MFILFRLIINTVILLFFIQFSFGQNSAVVHYKKTFFVSDELKSKMTPVQLEFFRYANDATFVLYISKDKSEFKLQEKIELDDFNTNRRSSASTAFGGGKGVYFIDLNKNLTLHQIETAGNLFLVESFISDFNWKITTEKKDIDGFSCFKAILKQSFKTHKGKVKSRTIAAWFSLDIPLPFGPIGYSGLPGLILELKIDNVTYKYFKIKYVDDELIKLKKPTKGKVLSQTSYNLLMEKIYKDLKG